ncbi:MAG TPA: L,D-transpeptidase [Polyangia bacterium]|nr:L,D-transpeptidase [Polyangia bacterium]
MTLSLLSLTALLSVPPPAVANDLPPGRQPTLMRTRAVTPVHTLARSASRTTARVNADAVLRVTLEGRGKGCRGPWMKREGGGFVCSDRLVTTDEAVPRPAPVDLPDLLEGIVGYRVLRGGSLLYEKLEHIDRRKPHILLTKGAVLAVRRTIDRYGATYHETREGWYARAERTEQLAPALGSLAVVAGDRDPWGVVVGERAAVRDVPAEDAVIGRPLARWSALPTEAIGAEAAADGWFGLRAGGFIRDADIARVRPAPAPAGLGPDERWIAVDLAEQLFHTYEGTRLLRVIPCSTGASGNTRPGGYRVQWKRRVQTMRPRAGHQRVEDVQWVLYYDRRRSIAIHAAYWHHDFGRPVSHGCVNLPPPDARWVYEWASPRSLPEDSQNLAGRSDPGTRVIVFE